MPHSISNRHSIIIRAIACPIALTVGGAPLSASAQVQTTAPVRACESFAGQTYYNVAVTSATAVPAADGLPAYCKVSGTERGTEHDIEVRMPDNWQRRYVQRGGGGFDGILQPVRKGDAALLSGAVQGANNGGHRDPTGEVLFDNPRVTERYAHGAILTATRFGKAITEAYYGAAPDYSYYEGCSNGGRGALNAAAKYGSEFDGVVAAAPTFNLVGQVSMWTAMSELQMPNRDQFNAINAAAVAKCDLLDGARDGIVANLNACEFDPARDIPAEVGLTPAQLTAMKVIMEGVQTTDGTRLYSGFGAGNLNFGAPIVPMFGVGHMRNVVLNDHNWSAADFKPDDYLNEIAQVLEGNYQFSAAIPDLVQFMNKHGKIIIWHGADDAMLSHNDTIRTWQQLGAAGGAGLLRDNARLYIAPGVNHCAGGPGADHIEALNAMMDWVENGKAPSTLVASKVDQATDATKFTRPLCEFPGYPQYNGSGDSNSADSFTCVTP
ncbi:MAG: tannase/feruloyl esterase family alpha/beta hydrolase [Gammaproteobacteria bacterium]|nr:tannase/feruloyl esterase family alpha/beta hydrolase [Gammaproteobacteria bacterium]